MNTDEQVIAEAISKATSASMIATGYVFVALLRKMVDREVLSVEEVELMLDELHDLAEASPATTQDDELVQTATMAIVTRVRSILCGPRSDPA